MGLFSLLALPLLGPARGLSWLAEKVAEEAAREMFDEVRIRGDLLELQARYDLGEVAEGDYARQEATLLQRLNAIREAKGE